MAKANKMPKLGRRAQSVLNSSANKAANEPSTAEEFLEDGTNDEESGDRWISADLTKGLRFYQKAYTSYLNSIRLSPSLLDGYYNGSRLLFHVYNHYMKQDGVNVFELVNVPEALTRDDRAVVQPLNKIVEAHEAAIAVARNLGSVPWDLSYNTALVYTEAIESYDENSNIEWIHVINVGLKARSLFDDILQLQRHELETFIMELKEVNSGIIPETETLPVSLDQQDQYESVQDSIVPSTILETLISSYRLVQAILESVEDQSQLTQTLQFFESWVSNLDVMVLTLINEFGPEVSDKIEGLPYVENGQINDLQLAKACILGLQKDDYNAILEVWNSSELPIIPERYMMAADNLQTLIDRYNASTQELGEEIMWQILSSMNKLLKQAQDVLAVQHKEAISKKSEGLGYIIAQLSSVITARADLELQRSQLSLPSASSNQEVLLRNSKTFLKNSMNLANSSGGLRESMTERMLRQKRKVEAVMRLCLLEGKTEIEEIDKIMGRNMWTAELPSLMNLGFFNNYIPPHLSQLI